MKKLDLYIIKKFLGTFFFTVLLFVPIIIVFDMSENIQKFIEKNAPIRAIFLDYYLNFVPYLINQLSPLFIFISVIFFTSKMASNSEIVAILSGGISFWRMLRPYLISALLLTILSFYLNNFLIPRANKTRVAFEELYRKNEFRNMKRDIHMQINKTTYVYMTNFNVSMNIATNFSIENFNEKGELTYKLISDNAVWDSINVQWRINNYRERYIDGLNEKLNAGLYKDTSISLNPSELKRRNNYVQTMSYTELNELIDEALFKGSEKVNYYLVEREMRLAYPFAAFVLTIIGVSISSRKVRGGIGLHIGIGLAISAAYIMLMQIFNSLALVPSNPVTITIWLPNIFFGLLALYLLKIAPK